MDIVASNYGGGAVSVLLNNATVLPTAAARPGGAAAIYPNPSAGGTAVWLSRTGLPTSTTVQATIYNLLGQVVAVSSLPAGQDKNLLPTAQLPAGCYTVQLQASDLNNTQRLVLY